MEQVLLAKSLASKYRCEQHGSMGLRAADSGVSSTWAPLTASQVK